MGMDGTTLELEPVVATNAAPPCRRETSPQPLRLWRTIQRDRALDARLIRFVIDAQDLLAEGGDDAVAVLLARIVTRRMATESVEVEVRLQAQALAS